MHTQSKFRLLVVRLGAMGDILHALPAVTALRQAHPSWIIDWVIDPAWAPLLSANPSALAFPDLTPAELTLAQPLVNRVHLAPVKAWSRHPLRLANHREFVHVRRALRAARYDVVLDLQGAIRSAVLAKVSGARRRIGEADPRERPARWFFTERVTTQGVHVIEQDVELAAAIAGDSLQPVQPLLPLDPAAESWAAALLATSPAAPLALLNPGAGWGAKRWPADRYAAVARSLAARGFRVLANAGPGELPIAQDLQNQTQGAAEPVQPTLAQLIALTRRAAIVVAGDTGPLHLACALGRPVVGIYGPTDPARNGPFGAPFRVLRSPISRRDHSRHPHPEAGLLTIEPAQVMAAVHQLLTPEAAQ